MRSLFQTLQERGFIAQLSDESLPKLLSESRFTVYAGFDPTADSLHLGHLVPIMALSHFQRAGHSPLMVVGGATGMVGDPSGRSEERNLLTSEQIAANVLSVRRQMERFLAFDGPNPATILDLQSGPYIPIFLFTIVMPSRGSFRFGLGVVVPGVS
jgi:tyrosyl-tRNA synthetase